MQCSCLSAVVRYTASTANATAILTARPVDAQHSLNTSLEITSSFFWSSPCRQQQAGSGQAWERSIVKSDATVARVQLTYRARLGRVHPPPGLYAYTV